MILETATISVQPGREDEFVAALDRAKDVLRRSEGFQGISVHRGIERPSVFLLTLAWETLEHHTVGFRGGELFTQWRAIIGPFFAVPAQTEHWTPLD